MTSQKWLGDNSDDLHVAQLLDARLRKNDGMSESGDDDLKSYAGNLPILKTVRRLKCRAFIRADIRCTARRAVNEQYIHAT